MGCQINAVANNAVVHAGAVGGLPAINNNLGDVWRINDAGLQHLVNLANLQALNLGPANQIYDAALAALANLHGAPQDNNDLYD